MAKAMGMQGNDSHGGSERKLVEASRDTRSVVRFTRRVRSNTAEPDCWTIGIER